MGWTRQVMTQVSHKSSLGKDKRWQAHPSRVGEGQGAKPGAFVVSLYGGILILGLFLLFYNLDGRLLWGDEAETAVLAKNVVKFGVPKTVDGFNHITLYGGAIDGNKDNAWTWSPWLQEYVAAAAFKLFGATTWASRAPFAFIAWLSLVLFCFTVYRIYRDHWIALSSLVLLSTSEVFLLHARECRYYSISVFGEILLIYAAYSLIAQNRKGAVLMALALSLQFYSNYIIAAANLPALVILAWIASRETKRSARWIFIALGAFLLIIAPWLFYAKPWQQLGVIGDRYDTWGKVMWYLGDFHFYFLPWAFGLLPVFGAFAKHLREAPSQGRRMKDENVAPSVTLPKASSRLETLFLWLLPTYVAMLLVPPGAYTRYLLPILPIACLLAAVWIFRYIKRRMVAVAILLLQCTTNAVSVATGFSFEKGHPLRAPFIEYIRGITHPYQDRFSDVLDFLKTEARPGQAVFVFDPEFPLIFYTPLRILDARLLRGAIPKPLPDWILSESASGKFRQKPLQLSPALNSHYEQIVLSIHDSRRGGSIPSPEEFEYETAGKRVPFILYKKRNDSAP